LRIVEVGPRDGLQNEAVAIGTELKARFVAALAAAGLHEIEATSFVSPKWVPQLGDAAELWPLLPSGPLYSALVPNKKGLERAMEVGVKRIAVFTAASEEFVRHNVNMTIAQTLEVFTDVIQAFRAGGGEWVRAYVSTAFECPYAGKIEPGQVVAVTDRLLEMGVDEVSLGDTIGVAAPPEVRRLAKALSHVSKEKLAWHFHDTHGTAIANVSAALDLDFTAFDASAAGLGGCPYAPGAGGNLATEDLVYFLERQGLATGVDLDALARASLEVLGALGGPLGIRSPQAKSQLAAVAAAAKCTT